MYRNSDSKLIGTYEYDLWGRPVSVKEAEKGIDKDGILTKNPLRYRGYYYDEETGFYYLNARYYDPEVRRFISADSLAYLGANGTIMGYNVFAYCGGNPVNRKDPAGHSWISALFITAVIVYTAVMSGCSSPKNVGSSRKDLANAPNLDIATASPDSYNCYGNGIGKQIVTNPTGYKRGDSTRDTFKAVINDLGRDYVRELTSINDSIASDEFKVALKCGPMDYHFIRLDGNQWYNKSGTAQGLYIDQSVVAGDVWYAMWLNNGQAYIGDPCYGYPYYDDETIYFAVKEGWDAQ